MRLLDVVRSVDSILDGCTQILLLGLVLCDCFLGILVLIFCIA